MDTPTNNPHPTKPAPVEALADTELGEVVGGGAPLYRISHPKGGATLADSGR